VALKCAANILPKQFTRAVEHIALLLGGQPGRRRNFSWRAAVNIPQDHDLAPRIGQRGQSGPECLRLGSLAGRPRARELLPMIGVGVTFPLETVGINCRCGRKLPAPPREPAPERAAPSRKVGDHPSNRDLHRMKIRRADAATASGAIHRAP
jgi:hypothetical protein